MGEDVQSQPVTQTATQPSVTILHVKDFGAIPNDEKCDNIKPINDAIAAAAALKTPVVIEFESGTYHLLEPNPSPYALITIAKTSDLTLLGQTAPDGSPTTVIERNVRDLREHLDAASQFHISNSSNITIKNIVSDNKPAFTTAGKITAVDVENDSVEVEVFEGLPHFDGMQCYSANAWNLQTRELVPVRALTIGADPSRFKHPWQKIPGDNDRLYKIQEMGFANRVKVGQGISWHFFVTGKGRQFGMFSSSNITLENIHINNIKQLGILAISCRDLTFNKVIIKPVPPQLAVCSRDAFHLVCNGGTLLVDNCYVKGVRWDPFNVKSKFCPVTEVLDQRRIRSSILVSVANTQDFVDKTVVFWTGDRPEVLKIIKVDWDKEVTGTEKEPRRAITIEFAQDLPASVKAGSTFTPHAWNFDLATFKNSTFEGNCGRPILYQGENLRVLHCRFTNNTYESIALGPIDLQEGGFVRNVLISGNEFINTTWDTTTADLPHNGNIKTYQDCLKLFKDEPYNDGIVITKNIFKGINFVKDTSAISISNAQHVQISDNQFEDCSEEIYVDEKSTKLIEH